MSRRAEPCGLLHYPEWVFVEQRGEVMVYRCDEGGECGRMRAERTITQQTSDGDRRQVIPVEWREPDGGIEWAVNYLMNGPGAK
jgi:hypothetical protein